MTAARREKIDVPVLCVGNFTVGGAGKTPVAIALARQARRMKLSPGFLSRGYRRQVSRFRTWSTSITTAPAMSATSRCFWPSTRRSR